MTGVVLDGKYAVDRQLGEGGMGSVYLARHLGTKRMVAVKVIVHRRTGSTEFVERFRREAEAAGGLRHPNIVDVTDFGFATVGDEEVAYLVMEYLDGCSLADVLAEDRTVTLDFAADILDQTCDAIDEAHRRGIIHRDLKPQNIWLEPNRRGGFTVKVLDFGLAKMQDVAGDGAPLRSLTGDLVGAASSSGLLAALESSESTILGELPGPLPPIPGSSDVPETIVGSVPDAPATMVGAPAAGAALLDAAIPVANEPADEPGGAATIVGSQHAPATVAGIVAPAAPATIVGIVAPPVAATLVGGGGDIAAAAGGLETVISNPPAPASTSGDGPPSTDGTASSSSGRSSGGGRSLDTPFTSGPLTQVGTVLGTPVYMSPEQCRGPITDPRTDIYSLGVIAYEMLAGRPPFSGPDVLTVLASHMMKEPEPPDAINPRIPKPVSRVILQALAKNPEDRPARASIFASTLRANAEGTGAIFRRAAALVSEHFAVFTRLFVVAYGPLVLVRLTKFASIFVAAHMPPAVRIVWAIGFGIAIAGVATFVAAALMRGVAALLLTQLLVAPLGRVRVRIGKTLIRKRLLRLIDGGLWYLALVIAPLLVFIVSMNALLPWTAAGFHDGFDATGAVLTIGALVAAGLSGMVMFRNVVNTSMLHVALFVEGRPVREAIGRSRELVDRSRESVVPLAVAETAVYATILTVGVVMGTFGLGWYLEQSVTIAFATSLEAVVSPVLGVAYAMLYLKLRQAGGESIEQLLDDANIRREIPRSKWMQRLHRAARTGG